MRTRLPSPLEFSSSDNSPYQSSRRRQAVLSIISTAKVDDLGEIAYKTLPAKMNVVGRRLSAERPFQQARVIEGAKPHDLSKLFDKSGINRWSVLNKDKMHSIASVEFS